MCQNNSSTSSLFPNFRNAASKIFERKISQPTSPAHPKAKARHRRDILNTASVESSDARRLEVEIEGMRFLIPAHLAFFSGSVEQIADLQKKLYGLHFRLFSSDLHQQYDAFASDFGPVNLGVLHRFCTCLTKKIANTDPQEVLVYCFDNSFESQANASFLLAAFLVLCCDRTPQQAADAFICDTAPFVLRPFRDCTCEVHTFPLTLTDCLSGLTKAVQLGWYDMQNFDLDQYEALDDPCGGDIHQACPKFVAFKGPLSEGCRRRHPDEIAFPPSAFAPALRRLGVTCVVRLNDADTYNPDEFERRGLRHQDLYFHDCTAPPDAVVERFLALCDSETGRIAVHCRAGLGRTGTLIAVWMMRHCGFSANEAIGWLRIVRPGSVIGPQQQYLKDCERRPWHGNRLGRAVGPTPPAAPAAADQFTPPLLSMGPPDGPTYPDASESAAAAVTAGTAGWEKGSESPAAPAATKWGTPPAAVVAAAAEERKAEGLSSTPPSGGRVQLVPLPPARATESEAAAVTPPTRTAPVAVPRRLTAQGAALSRRSAAAEFDPAGGGSAPPSPATPSRLAAAADFPGVVTSSPSGDVMVCTPPPPCTSPTPSAEELARQVTQGMSRRGVLKAFHSVSPGLTTRRGVAAPPALSPLPSAAAGGMPSPSSAAGGSGGGGSGKRTPPASPTASGAAADSDRGHVTGRGGPSALPVLRTGFVRAHSM